MLQMLQKVNVFLFLAYAVVILVTGIAVPAFMGAMMCALLAYYNYLDYKQTKGRS